MNKVFYILIILIFIACQNQQLITKIEFNNKNNSISDSANTISSINKIENLYYLNYFGSYQEKTSFLNNWILTHADTGFSPSHNKVSRDCSLFSVTNDTSNIYLGRNFDWADGCGIVLGKYNPPGKYSSIAFARLEDMQIHRYANPEEFTDDEKMRFLYFPFYSVDGINEKGLAIGIAGVNSQKLKLDYDKEPIFITFFVRKVLDNCKNVEEAIELSKKYHLFDGSLRTISHHLLITDSEGYSVIIEYKNGEMNYIFTKNGNQVITNNYVFEKTIETNKKCWRYDKIFDNINTKSKIDEIEAINMLEDVYNGTIWSVVYNLKQLHGIFSFNGDYNTLYEFKLD